MYSYLSLTALGQIGERQRKSGLEGYDPALRGELVLTAWAGIKFRRPYYSSLMFIMFKPCACFLDLTQEIKWNADLLKGWDRRWRVSLVG